MATHGDTFSVGTSQGSNLLDGVKPVKAVYIENTHASQTLEVEIKYRSSDAVWSGYLAAEAGREFVAEPNDVVESIKLTGSGASTTGWWTAVMLAG